MLELGDTAAACFSLMHSLFVSAMLSEPLEPRRTRGTVEQQAARGRAQAVEKIRAQRGQDHHLRQRLPRPQ